MRTQVTHKEVQTFTFPMTNDDVLARVDEVNELNSQEQNLNTKKALIQKEIKQLQADQSFKLSCIARREEPRDVECEVVFDYEKRTVETVYQGQIMSSRRLSDWEYSSRPTDVFPETKKDKVEAESKEDNSLEGSLATAVDRAAEIAEKQSKLAAPSANVKAFSEAKTETTVENLNA